ncbi:hypothetical protein VN97_g788 [Penicillium thymicola]|uniref:Uncharacterized protein n=1 Tax=Penicillium thymicola TaxID=293382 RepID=A0AAI9TTE5_PENTH|nr:hypothetical protein VN97_g788 [Penicillium thymicola]
MIIGFPGCRLSEGCNEPVYYLLCIFLFLFLIEIVLHIHVRHLCVIYTLTRPKSASPCMTGPRKPMPLNDVTVNDEVALVEEYKTH